MKVVINKCYGGYGLSKEAYEYIGIPWDTYGFAFGEDRTHPSLVRAVEELGEKANGRHAKLKVVEIPDCVNWEITDYDGIETVREILREWT